MPDWEDLRHFLAFVRAGSLAAAARELKVEHATVARRIAALEQALSLKLVDRRARSYLLTADGRHIADLAGRMQEDALAVQRAAAAGRQEVAGEVTLGVPPATAASLLVPHLGGLHRRHPRLTLQVLAETRLASLHREVDLALRLSRPQDPALVVRRLRRLRFSHFASPAYLQGRAPADYQFVGFDDSLEDSVQQRQLRQFAAGRPLVMRSNSPDLLRVAARAGIGIALLAELPGTVDDPGLVRVPGGSGVLERALWLVVHRDLRHAPAVRAVADFLAGVLAGESVPMAGTGGDG